MARVGLAVLVAVLAVTLADSGAARTAGATFEVADAASFEAALGLAVAGDTIVLADGWYEPLAVEEVAYATPLEIVGGRGALLAGLTLWRARNVVLRGFTLTPPADAHALLSIAQRTSDIVVDGVLVDGRDEAVGASINVSSKAERIVIRNSEFTNCGGGDRCVDPGANGMTIEGSRFYDCFDCDFIRGAGNAVVVANNTFDRAVPGTCAGLRRCPHNDHVQILGGGPWTIVGNRFGERRSGAGAVFVGSSRKHPGHDILIASNYFADEDDAFTAIQIGPPEVDGVLLNQRVSIVNNTILAGDATAVNLHFGWKQAPPEARPLVANNILGVSTGGNCRKGRFVSNLALEGAFCNGATGDIGPANLDADGRPTAASLLVIDRADPALAPAVDALGIARVDLPDRGAFEFLPLGGL